MTSASRAPRAGERAPLVLIRLVLTALGGVLIIPAAITKASAFAVVSSVLLLLAALLVSDSVRHRRSGAALLPPIVGLGASVLVLVISLIPPWRIAAVLAGLAALLCLGQLVWNWPRSQKAVQADIAAAVRRAEAQRAAGR